MSIPESNIYHCGRCGALFAAAPGHGAARRCPDCGHDPVPSTTRELAFAPAVTGGEAGAETRATETSANAPCRGRNRPPRRTATPGRNLFVFLAVWLFLLTGFGVGMKLYRNYKAQKERDRSVHFKEARRALETAGLQRPVKERERVFLQEALPKCQTCLLSFLSSTSPELRAQWVFGGPAMVGKMSRFQGTTSLFLPTEPPLLDYAGVIETSDGPLVESMWTTKGGYRIEAVFRRDHGEWLLDWEAFTRFSEIPWAIFIAGAGDTTQEFRMLARERLPDERKLDPEISLVLYPTRFGVPDEASAASPELLVPRISEAGRRLQALFQMHAKKQIPLGARIPAEDPADMIRVRVRVKRSFDTRGVRHFHIEEVLAGHWLSIADHGIPAELLEEQAGGDASPVPEPAPKSR